MLFDSPTIPQVVSACFRIQHWTHLSLMYFVKKLDCDKRSSTNWNSKFSTEIFLQTQFTYLLSVTWNCNRQEKPRINLFRTQIVHPPRISRHSKKARIHARSRKDTQKWHTNSSHSFIAELKHKRLWNGVCGKNLLSLTCFPYKMPIYVEKVRDGSEVEIYNFEILFYNHLLCVFRFSDDSQTVSACFRIYNLWFFNFYFSQSSILCLPIYRLPHRL